MRESSLDLESSLTWSVFPPLARSSFSPPGLTRRVPLFLPVNRRLLHDHLGSTFFLAYLHHRYCFGETWVHSLSLRRARSIAHPFLLVHSSSALAMTNRHPDGELNLTRGAGKHGVIQMVRHSPSSPFSSSRSSLSTPLPTFHRRSLHLSPTHLPSPPFVLFPPDPNSSKLFLRRNDRRRSRGSDSVLAAVRFSLLLSSSDSCSFSSLPVVSETDRLCFGFSHFRYVNKDREKTKAIVQHAEKRGIKVRGELNLIRSVDPLNMSLLLTLSPRATMSRVCSSR